MQDITFKKLYRIVSAIRARLQQLIREVNELELDAGVIVPTRLSELENDVGYLDEETDPLFIASEAVLLIVGDKDKLDGIEDGAEANVQADWNDADVGSDAHILNKPTIISDHNDLGSMQGGQANEYYHLTAAEKTLVENTSGSNTGDQDLSAFESTTELNTRDTNNRARANHTGTQLAATISDFSTAVAATASVTANTAKVTNATHTGDVTGATALTIANDAVTNAKAANMAVNTIKGRITSGTGDPEDLSATNVRTIINVANGADVTSTTNVGTSINSSTAKTTPADGDLFAILDSAASNILKKMTWANVKAAITALYVTLTTTQTITGVKTFSGPSTPSAGAIFQGSVNHSAYFHPIARFNNSAGAQKSLINAVGGAYWSSTQYILGDTDTYLIFMRNHTTQTFNPIMLQNAAGSQNIFLVSPAGRATMTGAYLVYAPTTSDMAAITEGMCLPRNADLGNQIVQDYQDELAYVDKFADSITISTAPLATVSDSGFTVNEVMFRDNADYNVWIVDPSPLIIEIDMTTNPIPVRSNATWQLGLTTRSSGVGVNNIKVEIWDGSAYATVFNAAPGVHGYNITGFGFFCTPQFVSYAANGYVIEKLKVTVDVDASTVANGFRIQRMMLYHPTQTWDPWKVSRGGDKIYGDLEFPTNSKGIILKDRVSGTRYRLYMSSGSLLTESV